MAPHVLQRPSTAFTYPLSTHEPSHVPPAPRIAMWDPRSQGSRVGPSPARRRIHQGVVRSRRNSRAIPTTRPAANHIGPETSIPRRGARLASAGTITERRSPAKSPASPRAMAGRRIRTMALRCSSPSSRWMMNPVMDNSRMSQLMTCTSVSGAGHAYYPIRAPGSSGRCGSAPSPYTRRSFS